MGCGCGGGNAATQMKNVPKFKITDDPESREYLTELEAKVAQAARNLDGEVVASK